MPLTTNGHLHPCDGAWIVSEAQMDDSRNVVCNVSLTGTYKLAAFTANVFLEYLDQNGHMLGKSETWTHDCGPAPLFGAAHINGTFTEIAPVGTTAIVLVQAGDYVGPVQVVINTLGGVIIDILTALGGGGSVPNPAGKVDFPSSGGTGTDSGTDGGTDDGYPEPPDWEDMDALKGHVQVVHS